MVGCAEASAQEPGEQPQPYLAVVARPDLDVVTKAAASDANGRVVVLVQVTNVGSGGSTATTLVSHPPGYAAAAANVPPLAPHGRVKLQLVLQAKRGAHAEQAKVTVDPGGSTGDNILGNNSDLTQLLPAFGP